MQKCYVVYICERLQDGIEEGAKIVSSIEKALEEADKVRNGFCGSNIGIKIFELGKEISIEEFTKEEVVVTKQEVKGFKVKEKK